MRVLVVIPTFNEFENLSVILPRLFLANPNVNALVVDDSSPDGTGELADQLAASNQQVKVLHRTQKDGLGGAYRVGFGWGLENNFDVIVEMDADGSHQPEQLPSLLEAVEVADLAIGSRWVKGGSVVNWPASRKILSKAGNLYARMVLGIKVKDATAGFRAFRAQTIIDLGLLQSTAQGYVFQVDSTFRAARIGLRIVEVPIQFIEREIGESKMSRHIVVEAMWQVSKWAIAHRILRRPIPGLQR